MDNPKKLLPARMGMNASRNTGTNESFKDYDYIT